MAKKEVEELKEQIAETVDDTQDAEIEPASSTEVVPEVPQQDTPEEKPQINEDEIVAKAAEKAKQELLEKLSPKEQEEVDLTPWEKEGRNPKDWKEVADWTAEQAEKRLQERQQKVEQERVEKEQQAAKEKDELVNSYVQRFNTDHEYLVKSGAMPKVEDANNSEDVGVKARKQVEDYMIKNKLWDFEKAYYRLKNEGVELPGAKAPVFGGKRAGGSPQQSELSYEELHSKSLRDL